MTTEQQSFINAIRYSSSPLQRGRLNQVDDSCSYCYSFDSVDGSVGGFPSDPQVHLDASVCVSLCRGGGELITLPDGRIAIKLEMPPEFRAGGLFLFLAGLTNTFLPPYGTVAEEALNLQLSTTGVVMLIYAGMLVMVVATTDDDYGPCSEDNMIKRIGGQKVADVVYSSRLGDRVNSKPVKPTQISVQRVGLGSVTDYASQACKGSPFPPIDLYTGRRYDAIDEGHHRFVASRLVNIPVLSSGKHRPTSVYDYDRGDFVAAFEWTEVEWSN